MAKKVIMVIAGSRKYGPEYYDFLANIMDSFPRYPDEIVSGTCHGTDQLGESWAEANGVPVLEMPADWGDITVPGAVIRTRKDGSKYNARAGHDRNGGMAEISTHTLVLWDGTSTGTRDMCVKAVAYQSKLFVALPELVGIKPMRSVTNKRNGHVAGAVYCGRPSKWGNQFTEGADGNRDEVCDKHHQSLLDGGPDGKLGLLPQLGELSDVDGECWCDPLRCHVHTYEKAIRLIGKGLPVFY